MDKDDWTDVPLDKGPDDWKDVDVSQGDQIEAKSPVTAASTGFMRGMLPFGAAGTLAGIGKAGMDAITGVRGPLAGEDLSALQKDYQQAKESFESDARIAEEENPGVSIAAQIAPGAIGAGKLAAKGVRTAGGKVLAAGGKVLDYIAKDPEGLKKALNSSMRDKIIDYIAKKRGIPVKQSIPEPALPGGRYDPFLKKGY